MESSELYNNVPENLLCPICFEIPPNEVFQCKNEHIICGMWYPQLSECPQCDVPLGGETIRNRFLEGILSEMKEVKCPFMEHGCGMKIFGSSIRQHVETCIYNKSK